MSVKNIQLLLSAYRKKDNLIIIKGEASCILKMNKLDLIEKYFIEKAKFMLPAFQRQSNRFGDKWKEDFLYVLDKFFQTDDELLEAVRDYNNFVFDGMRLQKKFEKSLKYEKPTGS